MSGVYIGVDGKARKVKGAYIGVDGVARKIKKGYIGDENGVARLCWTAFEADPVFANNTWEKIVEACQTGNVPDTWAVGNQKTMTIDGTDYTIDIIGKNHDDYADGSGKAPLTFQLHDCYTTGYKVNSKQTNVGGWVECEIRKTHLPNILGTMPAVVRNSIKEVNKLTSEGSKSNNITTSADKLFLLSEVEIFGRITHSISGEGQQYAYYSMGSSTIKKINDEVNYWWERSPKNTNTASFCIVNSSGSASELAAANGSLGVSFAFCF